MISPCYVHVAPGAALPALVREASCFILILDEPVDDAWRSVVSRWIVEAGGLYVLCWGTDCSAWDDAVDWANIEAWPDVPMPPEALVITTWHERESLHECLSFAKRFAAHPVVALRRTVLLHVAVQPGEMELKAAYSRA